MNLGTLRDHKRTVSMQLSAIKRQKETPVPGPTGTGGDEPIQSREE